MYDHSDKTCMSKALQTDINSSGCYHAIAVQTEVPNVMDNETETYTPQNKYAQTKRKRVHTVNKSMQSVVTTFDKMSQTTPVPVKHAATDIDDCQKVHKLSSTDPMVSRHVQTNSMDTKSKSVLACEQYAKYTQTEDDILNDVNGMSYKDQACVLDCVDMPKASVHVEEETTKPQPSASEAQVVRIRLSDLEKVFDISMSKLTAVLSPPND